MIFEDVVKGMSEKTEFPKRDVEKILRALPEFVKENVQNEEVLFLGLGKFSIKDRNARKGRNPQTGEELMIPACKVLDFEVSPKLKKELKVIL